MKIKTNELTGSALDWVVTQTFKPGTYWESKEFLDSFHPSTDWSLGGPIIEREGLCLHRYKGTSQWSATYSAQDPEYYGPTPLIAAMRCYVASKLGDEVEIPDELV